MNNNNYDWGAAIAGLIILTLSIAAVIKFPTIVTAFSLLIIALVTLYNDWRNK